MGFLFTIFDTLAVLKRNPWMKIDKGLAKKALIISNVPPWTRNKALRRPGTKAINDIFTYVRKQVADLTVRGAVRVVGEAMKGVGVEITTKSALDADIAAARKLYPELAKLPAEKRADLIRARAARVSTLEALAREVGARR